MFAANDGNWVVGWSSETRVGLLNVLSMIRCVKAASSLKWHGFSLAFYFSGVWPCTSSPPWGNAVLGMYNCWYKKLQPPGTKNRVYHRKNIFKYKILCPMENAMFAVGNLALFFLGFVVHSPALLRLLEAQVSYSYWSVCSNPKRTLRKNRYWVLIKSTKTELKIKGTPSKIKSTLWTHVLKMIAFYSVRLQLNVGRLVVRSVNDTTSDHEQASVWASTTRRLISANI